MSEKKRLALDNLTFIDESQVPVKRTARYTPYRDILRRIKKGKALVISNAQVNIDTFRAGIRRLQEKGEFADFVVSSHKDFDGTVKLYIVNPTEKEET